MKLGISCASPSCKKRQKVRLEFKIGATMSLWLQTKVVPCTGTSLHGCNGTLTLLPTKRERPSNGRSLRPSLLHMCLSCAQHRIEVSFLNSLRSAFNFPPELNVIHEDNYCK
eukprot:1849808-Amphidinium_carterae.3